MNNYIDLHCDALLHAYMEGLDNIVNMPKSMVDVNKLSQVNCLAQFFAIFMIPKSYKQVLGDKYPEDDAYIESMFKIINNTFSMASDKIELACNIDDFEKIIKKNKIAKFLTLEDGRAVNGSLEKLEDFYNKGIRLISLTWNEENCFGYPNSNNNEIMNKGLTQFGKEAIIKMNDLGIVIDVSHLSDGGFYDIAELSKKPFIASHSNARVLSPHCRNLTDDMIKIIGNKGGVVGVNFGGEFLQPDATTKKQDVEIIIKHIKHIVNVGGLESVSIGGDFDGIHGDFEIKNCLDMPILFEGLHKNGFSLDEIDVIAFENAKRIIKDIMK